MRSFEAGASKIARLPQAKPVAVAVAETMTAAPELPVLPASRHILLEGYPLIKDKTSRPRVSSNEEIKLVSEMFHETYEVSVNVSYMIVRCHKLPKKPWPLTIGGMPLWITSDATETPEIEGRGGRAPPIMEHLPFSTIASSTGQHFNLVAQYFLNSLDITVSEIMWNGVQLRLTIPDDVRPERLPFKIGKLLAVYTETNAIPEHRANDLVVGTVESIFEDTDISLAKLRLGIRYAAQTFGSDLKPSIEMKSMRKSAGLLIGDNLTLENSFSGLCEGIFMEVHPSR